MNNTCRTMYVSDRYFTCPSVKYSTHTFWQLFRVSQNTRMRCDIIKCLQFDL